ncbi:tripartite tricarboxylate transporter substrate binding protein [Alcaligenaceae bacterium]|nr:tripartite tricarboxylate transporter substrate binding protein [Alcaligenaceae bacterium]
MHFYWKSAGVLAACTLALAPLAHTHAAESFPSRPIKVMVGFAPGGSTDAPVRVLGELVSRKLGQPVVIENRTGVGGTMPAAALQNAAPDGYTLGITSLGMYRMPYTVGLNWDPVEDLSYVIGLTGYAFGVVVLESSPIKTWEDFVAAARKNPGAVTYGTTGIASTQHLTMEQISRQAGIELNHIPFKGSAEALQAVAGGHVDSAAETSAWAPFVQSGRMRALVTWGEERMAAFPDVPTLREVGIPMSQSSYWGLVAPKDTDPAIVAKLHDAFKDAMEQPAFAEALAKYDMVPHYRGSREFRDFGAQTMREQKEILDELGLSQK